MTFNWQILGHFYSNQDVADALNSANIGIGGFVGLNTARTQFTVWGNNRSITSPGYVWKVLTETNSEGSVTTAANEDFAIAATSTVNANGDWVLWGYVPST